MKILLLLVALSVANGAENPASKWWADMSAKRDKLSSFHQEFEVSHTYQTSNNNQSSKRQIVLDMAHAQWREQSVSGSGSQIRIFDGDDVLVIEEGGNEYVRPKRES